MLHTQLSACASIVRRVICPSPVPLPLQNGLQATHAARLYTAKIRAWEQAAAVTCSMPGFESFTRDGQRGVAAEHVPSRGRGRPRACAACAARLAAPASLQHTQAHLAVAAEAALAVAHSAVRLERAGKPHYRHVVGCAAAAAAGAPFLARTLRVLRCGRVGGGGVLMGGAEGGRSESIGCALQSTGSDCVGPSTHEAFLCSAGQQ